jgi:hypothetical protein
VELLNYLFNSYFVCKLGFFCMSEPRVQKKKSNLYKNELNTTFFCSTRHLNAKNRLKA